MRENRTRTHMPSLTYKPKIEAVKAGTIRQTVRLKRSSVEMREGDKLILHTWAGKPYRSKWDWRFEGPLKRVFQLRFIGPTWEPQVCFDGEHWLPSDDQGLKNIALDDGIENASAFSFKATLMNLNGLKSLENTVWNVIRW